MVELVVVVVVVVMSLWVLLKSVFKLLLLPYKCVWCSFGFWYLAGGAVLASGLSILGFESVGEAVTPSSEPALLLRLAEPLALFGMVLHTESSDLERPMKRDTLPERAASINVPTIIRILYSYYISTTMVDRTFVIFVFFFLSSLRWET